MPAATVPRPLCDCGDARPAPRARGRATGRGHALAAAGLVAKQHRQGSLRVAQQDLAAWLENVPDVMEADPLAAAKWLNQRPTRAQGKLLWPDRAMLQMVCTL